MDDVITVEVFSWTDNDWATHEVLRVNGKDAFGVHPLCECPEDAIIGRDLVSCSDIAGFLKNFLVENQDKKIKFEYKEISSEESEEI